jgi:antitoxin HicB
MTAKTANKYIGSDFDDFLEEEGLLEEAEAVAAKRVFVFQLEQELKRQKVKKEQLAHLMGTSRSSIRRLLDPYKPSTLRSLSQAAHALGKHLRVSIV